VRLVFIGFAAGVFGALFGVGGGILMVPLLLLATSLTLRPAMATSLLAVGLSPPRGSLRRSRRREAGSGRDRRVAGDCRVVLGTGLQQRLATRTLTLAFAVLPRRSACAFLV
jgi:uncharacterized membrane protein YfcA